jgi:hypothetical protein
MFRAFADWALSLLNTSRKLSETRAALRHLEERVRDPEEGMRVLSQQLRHFRELDASEREKLVLKIEGIFAKGQLPLKGKRKAK